MSSGTSESTWRWERGLDAVWTLWFDQPGRSHNLIDPSTLDELEARLVEAEGDSSIKGLVIRKLPSQGGFWQWGGPRHDPGVSDDGGG